MNRHFKSLSMAVMLAAVPAAIVLPPTAVQAQAADAAVTQVQGFYDTLLAAMKMGGTTKSRFDKLKPGMEKAFDFSAMTAAAVGPTFATMPEADKKALTDAFERMTIATYAKNFDDFEGEKFPVEPASVARGTDKFVKSKLVSGSETHTFNYRMHQVGSEWKVTDVLLEGSISQMAQKRSDFATTLASGGPQALTKRLNALTDQMLN